MIPWEKIAQAYGFKSPEGLWKALYPKYSISQLAMRFGVSHHAIRENLKRYDIEMRPRGGSHGVNALHMTTEEELTALGARGIADKYGVDVTTVYKHFKRMRAKQPQPSQPTEPATEQKTGEEDPEVSQ